MTSSISRRLIFWLAVPLMLLALCGALMHYFNSIAPGVINSDRRLKDATNALMAHVQAKDGQIALDLAKSALPSVVVLDIMMPGIDGIEVCQRLDHEQVKVVVLTARDDPALEKACQDAGADAFLTKPFSSIELLDLVAQRRLGDVEARGGTAEVELLSDGQEVAKRARFEIDRGRLSLARETGLGHQPSSGLACC